MVLDHLMIFAICCTINMTGVNKYTSSYFNEGDGAIENTPMNVCLLARKSSLGNIKNHVYFSGTI